MPGSRTGLTPGSRAKEGTDGPVRPPAPAITAVLLRSIAERWQVFASQVARTRRRPTEKAIHDLRVATRRLIATLDIVRTVLPGDRYRKPRRRLKRHLKAFSALRDLQVQIIVVRGLATRFPILRLFLTVMTVREKLLLGHARREILAMPLQSIEQEVSNAENDLEALLADPVMRDAARSVVFGALGSAFTRAAELKAGAMSGSTRRIHKFRISFKRFRYAVEALQPLLPGANRKMMKAMNRYQVRMGDIQDMEVLNSSVNAFARRRSRSAPIQFLRLKEHLLSRRKELITQFTASAGELDRFWFDLSVPGH